MWHSVFPELSTQVGARLIFPSLCPSLSTFLSVSSFLFSKISLPDILKPILIQAPVPINFFQVVYFFNCFIFITAFWFTGKGIKLQILKLDSFCGRKFIEYVFSFYKRITHLQPCWFLKYLAAEDQEILVRFSYTVQAGIRHHVSSTAHNGSIPVN